MVTMVVCNKCDAVIARLSGEYAYILDMKYRGKYYQAEFCNKCAQELIEKFKLEEES